MDREEGERRSSEETRRDHGKELVKRDSFRSSEGASVDSPRQRKFISSWRLACDKTKDRTKELLSKWRTMPEGTIVTHPNQHNWSVHVWATWVKRYPSDDDAMTNDRTNLSLSEFQREKLSHVFSHLFDMDRDDIIAKQDFESFTERSRHYADWTTNSGEYLVLKQVQQGFIDTFIVPLRPESSSEGEAAATFNLDRIFLSIDDWLWFWNELLAGVTAFKQLPVWLQYFPKILFNVINRSGSGVITRDELSGFYSSLMGFSAQRVGEILDRAYLAMTANGDFKLDYSLYQLCFSNFLLGRFPNGPGQYLFGCASKSPAIFPIDYSAMNTQLEELECYSHEKKRSNRTSIIV